MISQAVEDEPLDYEKPAVPKSGRGWHGDSEGHRKAGQIGGRQSAERRRKVKTELINKSQPE